MTPTERGGRLKVHIVGVGGQGVVTISRCLGDAALASGLEVAVGQLHGMSQRGGSVETSVLIGKGSSAFVSRGEADVVLGLEPLEVLRALPKMSARTRVIVNLGRVIPSTLARAGESYPEIEEILGRLREVTDDIATIDGNALAEEAGEARALNVVLLGYLAGTEVLPFDAAHLWVAIEARSSKRFLENNRRAFDLGLAASRREAGQ